MKREKTTVPEEKDKKERPTTTEGRRQKELLDAIEEELRLEKEKKEKEEKERQRKEKEEQKRKELEKAKAQAEKEKKDEEARKEAKFHQKNCDKMIATTLLTTGENSSEEKTLAKTIAEIQQHQWKCLQEYAKDEIPPEYYDTLLDTFTEEQKKDPKPMLSLNMNKDNADDTSKLFADQEYHNQGDDENNKDRTLIFVPHSATARAILAKILEEKFPEDNEVPHSQHEQQKKSTSTTKSLHK